MKKPTKSVLNLLVKIKIYEYTNNDEQRERG